MKKVYKTLSMQKKLLLIFLVCTLIPVLCIFIFSMTSLRSSERNEYNAAAEKKLISAANLIDKNIDENILKGDNIIRSSFVINGLKKDYADNIGAVMEYCNELDVFMAGFGVSENSCVIYPFNSTLPSGKYINSIEELKKREDVWSKLEKMNNSGMIWDYTDIKLNAGNGGYISFIKKINNYEEILGYFETRIYMNELIYPLQNMATVDGEVILYTDGEGRAFFTNAKELKKNYDISHSARLRDGSVISCMIDNRNIFKTYYQYLILYFFGFTILLSVMFFIYKAMVATVTRDLNEFISLLQNNEEIDADIHLSESAGESDITIIKQRFNDLLKKTKKMYSDINEMSRTKKAMELELLQSGINPHLLYNSLSVIKWQLLRLNQKGIADMIDNMTDYYRSVLAGGNHVITIREELELVDRYIKINEFSYENTYTIIKNIDEDVLDCSTIKLILQPIVENSILHGLVDKDDGNEGIIKITIKKNGENIIFKVEDNGYGMSSEDIQKALDLDKIPRRKGGYGIKNTIKRIKTYYGSECGLDIQSKPGKGTVVTINIIDMNRDELKKRLY